MKHWLYLSAAIIAEVIATSALKSSNGFTKLWPSLLVVAGYGTAFYLFSFALRVIPMGVAYAVWAGVGIALITIVAWLVFGQRVDLPAFIGMALIVAGVVVLNVFSRSAAY